MQWSSLLKLMARLDLVDCVQDLFVLRHSAFDILYDTVLIYDYHAT